MPLNRSAFDTPEQISVEELVQLCALDNELFSRTFFPNTMRQASAPFHTDMWNKLMGTSRMVNLQVFRGGAKTSLARMYTAKRIAYGLAHTILYLGKSEGHAIRSIKWLRQQVEFNKRFSTVFNLEPGSKWQDTEAQIHHKTEDYNIWLMGTGIHGSVRGINFEDFRPDLIVLDDILDEENSATPEQREKIIQLVYGAVLQSLSPESETPDAKCVMLNTPMNRDDISVKALTDDAWDSAVYGCFTEETRDLELSRQVSSWTMRWSTVELQKKKQQYINRNQLSTWLREMECKLVSPETSSFRKDWLEYYDLLPETMVVVLVIDPVPPPSDIQIAKGMKGKDYEAFAVVGKSQGKFYLLDYQTNRGHEPDWTLMTFSQLTSKWHPRRILVESVAYQRTLAWLLRQFMKQQGKYFAIHEFDDKRKKYDRIVDGLNGPAANGSFFVRKDQYDFIAQFEAYPDISHDDLIEAVAVGVADLNNTLAGDGHDEEEAYLELISQEGETPLLEYNRGAP
jgi:predicted phage terminase large subunit-like protein